MYHLRFAVAMALSASLICAAGCAASSPIDKAIGLTRNHQEDEAIRLLVASLEKHPEDLKARKLLIRVYAETGDLGEAKLQIDDLSRRLPTGDPTPDIELGHAYELAHKFEEALAAYDAASKIAPNSPAGPHEGGMRAAHWGEVEAAEPRLAEAVRRGDHEAETFHALGLVRVHTGDLEGAQAAYRAGLAVDPNALENWLGLATVAVVRGDGASALAAYDAILARRPDYASAVLGRAWALGKLGRKMDAEKALDHALEIGAPKANVDKQRAALDAPAAPPIARP
ncbi:MAG: tetratricopeptide repeat protein, partial [Polyangiaceae bacterium]